MDAVISVTMQSFPTSWYARSSNRQLSLCDQNTKVSNKSLCPFWNS